MSLNRISTCQLTERRQTAVLVQGARDLETGNGRRGEEGGRPRRSLEWVEGSIRREDDGDKNFDMYWAFVTGLGVQQDTLGAQNRFFFFGWSGREHLSTVIGRIRGSAFRTHLGTLFWGRVYTSYMVVSAPLDAHKRYPT